MPPPPMPRVFDNSSATLLRLENKLRACDPDFEGVLQPEPRPAVAVEPVPSKLGRAVRRIRRLRAAGISEVTADHLLDLDLTEAELLDLGLDV